MFSYKLLLTVLFVSSFQAVSVLGDTEKKYRIKSFLSATPVEWCVELVPLIGNIVIDICDEDSDYQIWTIEDGRVASLSAPDGCVTCNLTNFSRESLLWPLMYQYNETFCGRSASSGSPILYNMFDDTIIAMDKALTVPNETAVQDQALFLSDKDTCLVGQKWILEEVQPNNQIKFLGKTCPGPDGCPVCSGDCNDDHDCESGLRCLHLESVNRGIGREDVPGCLWKSPNDPESLDDYDFCFEPIELPGSANIVGNCGYSTYLCKECEGNCAHDADCEEGLKCWTRFGFEAVPGCLDEGGDRDVYGKGLCYDPHLPENTIRFSERCTTAKPCEVCQGNCTVDADCLGDLRCARRECGTDVPGCIFSPSKPWLRDVADHNYCFMPNSFPANAGTVNYVGECGTEAYLCNRCEGDCKSDDDCIGDLKCMERHAFEAVPGCFRHDGYMDMEGKNICYDASIDTQPKLRGCSWLTTHVNKCEECQCCHNDHDCKGDLRCAVRDGLEDVPGCSWGGHGASLVDFLGGTNYCFQPMSSPGEVNYVGECSRVGYLCGACEGGCKSDTDCMPGLECLHRTAFDEVKGCSNEGGDRDMYGKGICFDPTFIEPTVSACLL